MKWRNEFFSGLLEGESGLPFRFLYDGQISDEYFKNCCREISSKPYEGGIYHEIAYIGSDGLRTVVELKLFDNYPAADIGLRFENTGESDSKIIERVLSADLLFSDRMDGRFLLHHANGAPSTPDDFLMRETVLWPNGAVAMCGERGRSSNTDLPFFRLDTGRGAVVFGVGWSGQWKCNMCHTDEGLRLTYGLAETHFRLYAGESVAMPSLTVLFWESEDRELCHSLFRRLVYDHYMPRLEGHSGDPYLFCNTCFTRFGGWLNECDEKNQISLIKAMEPLGVETVIVDAGWFVGGWPAGAGNWDADPEKYPNGMAVVAKAAHENGMGYGLWFELERVVKGTDIAAAHPEWLLYNHSCSVDSWSSDNMLLNMAIPEARAYALGIVENYLSIPHFNAYRQDFNVDPLDYWRVADAPDRIGMTELKYLAGLYEFLDAIRLNHPDCFMDGCASGGRRIDMRMIQHFHTHQKTDYWFNNQVDQNSLFALSHYLPSTCVTSHLNRYDDYSADSNMAATLCLGWIADAEDYPEVIADKLIRRYGEVRPLLNDQFFPLTPFSNCTGAVMSSQYHDRELDAGVIFLFLRDNFTGVLPGIFPRNLVADAVYNVTCLNDGSVYQASGKSLMDGMKFILPHYHGYSSVYKYEKV